MVEVILPGSQPTSVREIDTDQDNFKTNKGIIIHFLLLACNPTENCKYLIESLKSTTNVDVLVSVV